MGHLAYLVTILVFCGIPWLVMWHRQKRMLKRFEILILCMVAIGVGFSASEYFAIHWGAWFYNPARVLGVRFINEVETFGVGVGVTLGVASATILTANIIDKRSRPSTARRHHHHRS